MYVRMDVCMYVCVYVYLDVCIILKHNLLLSYFVVIQLFKLFFISMFMFIIDQFICINAIRYDLTYMIQSPTQ
jgi:hypothetical protein